MVRAGDGLIHHSPGISLLITSLRFIQNKKTNFDKRSDTCSKYCDNHGWYIGGPLIGLTVPALLYFSNRKFGVSSSFRHICAVTFPRKIPYFNYEWKKEKWNLFFVAGIVLGGFIASQMLNNPHPMVINDRLAQELSSYGINNHEALLPLQLFNWQELHTLRGIIIFAAGGFLVGFGTRYAGGCTSGHSIMGLSNLQPGSLAATLCFMVGGIIVANFVLPVILKL